MNSENIMIKVISFKICPFVQRVTASLAAKNIPFEVSYISLSDKPQWFLDISPNAQVPVLVTENGTALFESDAIVEFIEEQYGALNSIISSEQRALERAWSYLATKNYLAQCSAMRSQDEATFCEKSNKLKTIFEKVEPQLLADKLYFNANQLGKVDLAWLPLLHRADIINKQTGYDFLSGFPKVKKWQQALLNTDIVEKSVSDDFEQKFINFYLGDIFLGKNCLTEQQPSCCSVSSCCG